MEKTLWDKVIPSFEDIDFDNFRTQGSPNNRLGTWDPLDGSTRYFKSLMYEFCFFLEEKAKEINLGREFEGNPFSFFLGRIPPEYIVSGGAENIRFRRQIVSLDYLLSMEEMIFLHQILAKAENIIEIGAGFGRTAHTIVTNYSISSYTIVDLSEMLCVSEQYLRMVLPYELFSKLEFRQPHEIFNLSDCDLIVNVDSMNEMPTGVASEYLNWISENAKYFFSKNAMGKYDPKEISLDIKDQGQFQSALNVGLAHEVYPMFDSDSVEEARERYLRTFCPNNFELIRNQRGFGQYLFYELALYERR